MAGDENCFWFSGGSPFAPSPPPPFQYCHSPSPLYSPPPIPGGGPGALSPIVQHELFSEPPYGLPESSSGDGGDSYSLEWGVPSYSSSAAINGYPASSDVAGFPPFVDGALQCDFAADPLSALPGDSVALPFDSTASQFDGTLLSSSGSGASNFYQSGHRETPPYSSSVTLTGSPAMSGDGAAAAPFHPSLKQEPLYYSSGMRMPLIENPPAVSGNEPAVSPVAAAASPVAAAAGAGPLQAEPSEKNGLDISLIWTAEEQRQLNELYGRYAHIECHVARLAKIARPFHGKSIRDVALRIRWMEEKMSQRTKAVSSSRSQRALRVPGKSRDYSSTPSSQPGMPY